MNKILVLKHWIDGYNRIEAIFDQPDEMAPYFNDNFKKYNCMTNFTFDSAPLWETVQFFIDQDDNYLAKQLRRELDPEYAEYLRLKEKFG